MPLELTTTIGEAQDDPVIDPAEPPDGGYGWVIVGCCFTINFFTWGVIPVSQLVTHLGPSC
jgi:hypothetical protein